jgi:hypothetical protein
MHSDLALALYLAIAAVFCFAFGWLACAIIAGRRERLDALELAERADVNGQRLLVIARGLRDTPAPAEHRHDLDRWAGMLEDIARAHLECINAIGLDSLHKVNPELPVHLGDFVPVRPGSNPPPASARKPEPPANPPAAQPRFAYPMGSDREVLLYLMLQFDAEQWDCPRCGHSEATADMDSAEYLRRYLAKAPAAAGEAA